MNEFQSANNNKIIIITKLNNKKKTKIKIQFHTHAHTTQDIEYNEIWNDTVKILQLSKLMVVVLDVNRNNHFRVCVMCCVNFNYLKYENIFNYIHCIYSCKQYEKVKVPVK